MRLNTLIRRIERVQSEILPIVRKECEREERTIVDMNRQQMLSGYNANGELMNNGIYSDKHIKKRTARGLPVDHVYLSFEGDFQKEMFVEYHDTGFAVQSHDDKNWNAMQAMLTGYWPSHGEDPFYGPVFGLTAENRAILARKIAPNVARKLRMRILG